MRLGFPVSDVCIYPISLHEMMEKYITNEHRLKIKACCASCEHKAYDRGGLRICRLDGKGVKTASYVCTDYEMPESVMRCGASKGRVKRPSYIAYLTDIRSEEVANNIPGPQRKSVIEIRQSFREKYGIDVYL